MKTKYGLPLAILALALAALVGGCDIPDYQLDFSNIRVANYSSGYANVEYTIENYGSKDLSNVKLLPSPQYRLHYSLQRRNEQA